VGAAASDSTLVSRLRQGHPGAFDELYRAHRDRLWRFTRQLSGSTERAEEIFQDTWVAAARHLRDLREETVLLPWLFTIARNRHRNAMRAQVFDEQRRAGAGAEPVVHPPLPDAQADQRRRAERVTAAFAGLPEAHREVLLLCLVEGLATQEVAGILELSPEAVRKRLSRARAELAAVMARAHPEIGVES
jgi:RNA polymerase sigma-70 factor (ECF subfamily)